MILEPVDMDRALASHSAEPSPTLIAVQELILAQDNLGIDPGHALDAARVLLAAHARELATLVYSDVLADRVRNPGGDNGRNHVRRGGMMTAQQTLDRYADDLDAQATGAGDAA